MKYVTNVKFKEWLQKKTRKKQRQLCSEVSICIYNSPYMASVSYCSYDYGTYARHGVYFVFFNTSGHFVHPINVSMAK